MNLLHIATSSSAGSCDLPKLFVMIYRIPFSNHIDDSRLGKMRAACSKSRAFRYKGIRVRSWSIP